MRKSLIAALAVAFLAISASPAVASPLPQPRGWVTQIGTLAYLTTPNYSGLAPISMATSQATLGVGTFNHLSGELIMVDGVLYRVSINGRPSVVPATRTSPYIQAIKFRPQMSLRVPAGTACADLLPIIDDAVGTTSGVVALRVEGSFRRLQTRSVEGQSEPYPAFADVVAQQTLFTLDGRAATLVGFRSGPDMAGLSPVGVHLHGVTKDLQAGGHVVSCVAGKGVKIQLQLTQGVRVLGG